MYSKENNKNRLQSQITHCIDLRYVTVSQMSFPIALINLFLEEVTSYKVFEEC